MWILTTILISLVLSEFIGYLLHRIVHCRWTGPMYKSHMVHHLVNYGPESGFLSTKYISAGSHSLLVYAAPLFLLTSIAVFFVLPFWYAVLAVGVMAVVSLANNQIHDWSHIQGTFLERFRWFRQMREAHRKHHIDMRFNYGIWNFMFDRLFGTFTPVTDVPPYPGSSDSFSPRV